MPLATSPKLLSSKYSFGLFKNYSNSIHFVIPTSPNHRNSLFGLVTPKIFGTDCNMLYNYTTSVYKILKVKILFNIFQLQFLKIQNTLL